MPEEALARYRPGRLVVTTFLAAIAIGSIPLALPVARRPGAEVGLIDAVFTATSAVCVTGLTTLDTSATWSRFGEVVILLLMQIGGLGIMTLASLATVLLSRRMGIRRSLLAGTEMGIVNLGDLRAVIRAIAIFTFASEAVIAVVLTLRFRAGPDTSWPTAIFDGVFHAVSAFNNAGFSTFAGNLEQFVGDPVVCLTVVLAVIGGGIGFPVVAELRRNIRRPHQWSLHTKFTLATTGALLAVAFVVMLAIEWQNRSTFGLLSVPEKLVAALFEATSPRTAGFNTVPTGEFRVGTLLLVVLLMAIGGGSGSTAGGIKVSTFAVVLWTSIAELRGDPEVTAFARRIPGALQRQATTIVIVALGSIGTATFLLAMLLPGDVPLTAVLFETVSAFGTVGLSTGITPELTEPAKALLVLLMFLGRVGPLTLGTALLLRQRTTRFRYPEERLIVG